MKFVDLAAQYQRIKPEINQRIQTVLNHGQFIMGPEVRELEQELANFIGVKHAICLASGTTALQVAMMALNIAPGDEIITTPFSFFATVETIVLLGAKPVFVDIDPRTYNIDPTKIEAVITGKTKAIMPVSLYGQCADFDAINAIANKYNLPVIEDGAQSFGAKYKSNFSCNLSTIGCTSFFPAKPLGCYGDGGACFTNDDVLAEKMRWILNHGQDKRYHHVMIGINGRMDTLQAAIMLPKLAIYSDEIDARQQAAASYDEALKGKEGIVTPYIEEHNLSAYAQYTIQTDQRAILQEHLKVQDIPTAIHYPLGLHQQPILKQMGYEGLSYPVTELVTERVMSLPFHPYLNKERIEKVAEAIIG